MTRIFRSLFMTAQPDSSMDSDPSLPTRLNTQHLLSPLQPPDKLQTALDQAAQGRSIIPVRAARTKAGRIPLVKWKPYQTRRAIPVELRQWWREHPDANPVVVTGAISDIIAVDIDSPEGLAWVEAQGTPRTYTISRGHPVKRHLWFQHPGFKVSNITLYPGVEVKG